MILHPVIATFPMVASGRAAVEQGRRLARLALDESVRLSGAPTCEFRQDDDGAPMPTLGWHWSKTHTRGLAASIVAPVPVGIDAEWIERPRLDALRRRFSRELEVMGGGSAEDALRLWTAKEALLKMYGIGIADLARCPLVEAKNDRLVLEYRGLRHTVRQLRAGRHIISVCCESASTSIELRSLPEART